MAGEKTGTMIGVDLAKRVFQLHGASMTGHVAFCREADVFPVSQLHGGAVVCGGGDGGLWQRQLLGEGDDQALSCGEADRPARCPPLRQAPEEQADAEAIVIAAQRALMRSVAPKSEDQQARAVLFRARERLVHQRTELANALRGVLYEDGHVVPQGIGQLERVEAILDAEHSDLPALVREECQDMLEQIAEQTARIKAKTRTAKAIATQTDKARRLQTMPGVGPLTALAVDAFAPDMASFRSGRDVDARLGLVPRQHATGGKERLGRVSKAGQADIRRLLISGAMSRLGWLGRRSIPQGSWLARLMLHKPRMLVAIAPANKMARQIWAMLTKQEDYRGPTLVTAA